MHTWCGTTLARSLTSEGQRAKVLGNRPEAATGRNSSAPTRMIVPNSRNPKVSVSVRMVPTVNGVGFFFARLAAIASGAITGMKRLKSITRPVAMSHGRL